jgi:exonuclease SbcD
VTKLAVTADLHVSDYGRRVDPETGLNARFLDAVRMVRWIAVDAQARGCDALIVAGDICEERHPSPWRVAMIRDALSAFTGPAVVIRGNHDGERAGRSVVDILADALPGGRGFTRPGVTWVGPLTAICCLPYLDRHWLRAQEGFADVPDAEVFRVLGEQFLAIARGLYAQAIEEAEAIGAHPEVDPGRTREDVAIVLVCHQGLAGGAMSESQQAFLGDMSLVVDTAALAAIGFDAVLAGHFHQHQALSTAPLVAYPGSPHRVDFGEEADPKGYMVLDTADPSAFEFIETPARRFVTLRGTADLAREDLPTLVHDAIVRILDISPDDDPARIRRDIEEHGPFEITEVRQARVEAPEVAGMSESLTTHEAMAAYFADDPDREALLDRGRAILAEVAS